MSFAFQGAQDTEFLEDLMILPQEVLLPAAMGTGMGPGTAHWPLATPPWCLIMSLSFLPLGFC